MIFTFYSYKGGVGRTMALANIALILVHQGQRVLAIDWDLEAPGLDIYFRDYGLYSSKNGLGLLDLLIAASTASSSNAKPDWRQYLSHLEIDGQYNLSLLTSGRKDEQYTDKVLDFDWNSFFVNSNGGYFIESLREEWREEFDVILIDSRTGITDSGGVCTIQIPDILVPVFTATEQSLLGTKKVILSVQRARQNLAFDRMRLLVFPLPSRIESRSEFEMSMLWLNRIAREFAPFYEDWLPKQFTPLQIIERTKIPYIPYFSFGEQLAVMTHGTSDPGGIGYAYLAAATLIGNDFRNVDAVISGQFS